MVVILIVVGIILAVVVASVIGARRGTPMAFEAVDTDTERARASTRYFDGLGPTGPST